MMKLAKSTQHLVYTACLLIPHLQLVWSRGGLNTEQEDDIEEVEYPTDDTDNSYYEYYIRYFEPDSLVYAADNISSSRTARVCHNEQKYTRSDGQTVSLDGDFPCPMLTDPDDFGYCCGDSIYEYCCRLVDTTSFRVGVAVSCVVVVGVVIFIIVCLVSSAKAKKKERQQKSQQAQQMRNLGIPPYDTVDTNRYKAVQSPDGHQILVTVKKDDFYKKLADELQTSYPRVNWRQSNSGMEGKVTYEDGRWVRLNLMTTSGGERHLSVQRETAAYDWMTQDFQQICHRIPDDGGLCSCFSSSDSKTHPVQPGSAQKIGHGRTTSQQSMGSVYSNGARKY